MKRILSAILCFFLVFSVSLPVLANDYKIVDRADLLTDEEEEILQQQAKILADQYDMDVVILTVRHTEGVDVVTYADDYYDEGGYGVGPEYSGVLFLLAIETREWAISTCGNAIDALTDYGIERIFETFDDDLAENQFFQAFDTYLRELPAYFDAYEAGNPIDGNYQEGDYEGPGYINPADREDVKYYPVEKPVPDFGDVLWILFGSLFIGAIVGGIVLLILRTMMKTAVSQKAASSYLVQNSYHLTRNQNLFLYSKVSRIRRQQHNDARMRSSGGRSGSSVHRSSSGRSHGGRSGRF